MLRLICPKCNKDSYSADVESYRPCPYCGYVFSGKYGPDKRSANRMERKIPFVFPYQGQSLKASAVDFSEKGIGIKIFGEPPIAVGDTIDLSIGDLQIKAKVVWVKHKSDESMVMAGLGRLN